MFKIKHFNELTSNELYEICKSRYEVFACEQKIVNENDFDDIDKDLVLKEYRGKKIAKEMMDVAIRFIINNLNEEYITLSAQEYIKNLYLSCGFKEVSDIYYEAGIPHIKMIFENIGK